jgi:stearoyl-CoA desaturase (delta-9 desaturase)
MTASTIEQAGNQGPESAGADPPRTDWIAAIPFFLVHLLPLGAFFVQVTWKDWVLCGVLYVTRMFCITAGYHRYFSHRTYKMGRVAQFVMAFGGTTAVQKGPLWWASHHRAHHRFTDLDDDVHSPRDGFWWSHVGWILSTKYKETDLDGIKDFAAYPELRLLERFNWVGPWALGIACFAIGGWGGLFIGFFLSTVLLWHATFLVNSLAHIIGRRRYATPDTSRNSLFIALVTGGEGWHNNHHYLPSSVRQGFTWWEFDPTWYVLRGLAAIRVVGDLKKPPSRLLHQARVRDGAFDIGMFRSYWERAARITGERIADLSARPTPPSPEGTALHPTAEPAVSPEPEPAPTVASDEEPLSTLSGLISQALASADRLAAVTRRARKGTKAESPPNG